MIKTSVLKEIYRLGIQYEKRWGNPVDFTRIPDIVEQERLLLVLRIIVDSGESVIGGFEKVKKLLDNYYDYLASIDKISDGEIVLERCPICRNEVVYHSFDYSYEFKCKTDNCVRYTVRGI